ncbi:MAG: hypothetical protein ABUK01_13540 [Leptospirales bacterium]
MSPEKTPNALEYYNSFLKAPLTEQERTDLEQNKEDYLKNGSFEGELAFGTGGVREIVSSGSARLNVYNIARLTSALAKAVIDHFGKNQKVILAADSRLTSPLFSTISAYVLQQEGLQPILFHRPTPTPILSFAVREYKASAGIVITASHNPPEYNGFKVYWNDGAQIVSPLDKEIEANFHTITYESLSSELNSIEHFENINTDITEEDTFEKYIDKLLKEDFIKTGIEKKSSILYSPLHGTGGWFFERLFQRMGYNKFSVLKEQGQPDGNFPTIGLPNPEEEISFDLLKEEGLKHKTKLLLASDPDADRIGCAVYREGQYEFLTGNQIGALLMDHLLKNSKKNLETGYTWMQAHCILNQYNYYPTL